MLKIINADLNLFNKYLQVILLLKHESFLPRHWTVNLIFSIIEFFLNFYLNFCWISCWFLLTFMLILVEFHVDFCSISYWFWLNFHVNFWIFVEFLLNFYWEFYRIFYWICWFFMIFHFLFPWKNQRCYGTKSSKTSPNVSKIWPSFLSRTCFLMVFSNIVLLSIRSPTFFLNIFPHLIFFPYK